MADPDFRFNVRVYGIIFNAKNEVLLADEFVLDQYMTKFPGGGLEYGEGAIDCLKREAVEELGQEIEVVEHFYTTDFFQKALFFEKTQLISIYYLAKLKNEEQLKVTSLRHDLPPVEGSITFRWVGVDDLKASELTFPVDKYVVDLIRKKFSETLK